MNQRVCPSKEREREREESQTKVVLRDNGKSVKG